MNKEYLEKLRNKILTNYKFANDYKKKRLYSDINYFNLLAEVSGYPEMRILLPKIPKFKDLSFKIGNYLIFFDYIANQVINVYKEVDFFYAKNVGYVNLSKKDQEDILKEFFNTFCPPAIKIYEELLANGKIFDLKKDDLLGSAYVFPEINDVAVGINYQDAKSDLVSLEILVHELMHIYVEFFLKNYRRSTVSNTIEGFYRDTIPIYAELELTNFLIDKHISVDDMHFHANRMDYYYFLSYKIVNYVVEMTKRLDSFVLFSPTSYQVIGNAQLEVSENNPIYECPESYKSGSLTPFVYSMSLLDAYKLLEGRLNGEKNIINNYLISLQDENKFLNDIHDGYDFTLMRECIKNHQDKVLKIYGNN